MFLRPQHFQQNDRYFESLIENRCGPMRPYSWGIEELRINQEALSLGKIEVEKFKAILPDGTTVNIPSADAPPLPIEPDKNTKDEHIYLCLLEKRPNATEVSREDDSDHAARYGVTVSEVRDASLQIYTECAAYALERGIIIADTKFEFGLDKEGRLHLIDEILTPDSSRFWPADQYRPGTNPPSFDKQFVRDYLETLDWDKRPPGPELPQKVIDKTAEKYREAEMRLTGH